MNLCKSLPFKLLTVDSGVVFPGWHRFFLLRIVFGKPLQGFVFPPYFSSGFNRRLLTEHSAGVFKYKGCVVFTVFLPS